MRDDGAHTPGPARETVEWLIHERGVLGFAVETINTDAGQSHGWDLPYPCHTLMHGAGRFGLQCLCNLDQLPATGAMILAAPLKIRGGSGSPLRVLGLSFAGWNVLVCLFVMLASLKAAFGAVENTTEV